MTVRFSRGSAALASVAAFSLTASPVMANGWGDWGRHRHRDRVDVGDVLTGILIIGGIAAIASAASSSNRDRDRQREDRQDHDQDYPQDRGPGYAPAVEASPSWTEGGVGAAVDRCMQELSSGAGRDEIESVNRAGQGWRVQGRTGQGKAFSCTVDGSGRIRNISVEGEAY
ncbi:MAG: hypothetical protein ABL914_13195 [Novosphingobium sp.]|uniref:hypothetical protein n=1 Tax=Novosphingobium sp. TaxID=1874826 RepID=UPI0032B97AA5